MNQVNASKVMTSWNILTRRSHDSVPNTRWASRLRLVSSGLASFLDGLSARNIFSIRLCTES